jgi:hypothetical protein
MGLGRWRRDGARVLAVARVGIGVSMLARPALLPRVVGVGSATAARVSWLGLMVGARELALGVGTLNALRRHRDVGPWLLGGALSDVADAAAFAGATARRDVQPVLGALVALTAAGSAVTLIASWRDARPSSG